MKDRFEHILKDKLQDFSLKAEPNDWIKIERSLGLEKPKHVSLYRYVAAAAAVLIAGVLGFFMISDSDLLPENLPLASGTPLPTVEEAIEKIGQSAHDDNEAINAVLKLKDAIDQSNGRKSTPVQTAHIAQNIQEGIEEIPVKIETLPEDKKEDKIAADAGQSFFRNDTRASQTANQAGMNVTDRGSLLNKNRRPNSNWALSVFSNSSARGNFSNQTPDLFQQEMLNSEDFFSPIDNANSLVQYYVDGKSGLLKGEIGEWKHDIPLTFGFMLRKNLNEHWGVETGVTYSYLSSRQEITSVKMKQRLHYLGVPVAVTYTPFRTKNFDFYLRGGAAADFNLSGTRSTFSKSDGTRLQRTTFSKSGVQWSLSGNVGMMYNISPTFGLYVEPGISHHFTFSNQPESYWKKHPTNFNFKIGVRTNF